MNDQSALPKSHAPILRWIVPTLLLVHAGLLAYGDCRNSPAIDEVGPMAAGLSHWKLGRFGLYQVNPPLVRMVAVVPVLFAEPKFDWASYSDEPGARPEFEHNLSYFNELVDGPANGSAYLVDIHIDWGQDLYYLRDWLTKHPEARPLGFAYFGIVEPRVAGIEFTVPPTGIRSLREVGGTRANEIGPVPGWFALSVMMMRGASYSIPDGKAWRSFFYLQSFSFFQRFRPVAKAGWSIDIHHIDPEECARVREELGLPKNIAVTKEVDAPTKSLWGVISPWPTIASLYNARKKR